MTKIRYFLDTEFMEDGSTIDLLSIGIACEDGRQFYAVLDADRSKANDWVKENVLPHLGEEVQPYSIVRERLLAFIGDDEPEFWGDYASYDWVAIAQLFGTMMDLPKGWPMRIMDVQQFADHVADLTGRRPELPEPDGAEHHALHDARNVRQRWMICQATLSEVVAQR